MLHDAFQALADPTRREILRLLKKREMTAGEIADRFSLAKSTLSSHFSILRHAGLILAEKQGTTITYSLNVSAFEDVLAGVLELFQVGKRSPRTPSRRNTTSTPVKAVRKKIPPNSKRSR